MEPKPKEALFYEKLPEKKVRCLLCPRRCYIENDSSGFCRVRRNQEGKLYSIVYSNPCALSVDPIEKKPLYHFFPHTSALSIATCGCNLECRFCQNHTISHGEIFGEFMPPEEVIKIAKKHKVKSIAYTYTEPTIFYEYCLDIMKLAKTEGIKNVWVSNGYINKTPIKKMGPYLDAVNIDVKGPEKFYSGLCFASLKPVLESLIEFKKLKIWIEITCLIIPTHNDSERWINHLSNWIKNNIGRATPLHLSGFYPMHKLKNIKPTKLSVLKELHEAARKKLDYVYIGNASEPEYENTYCPRCGKLVIDRARHNIKKIIPKCRECNKSVEGIFY